VDAQGAIVGRFHRLPEVLPLIEGWLASEMGIVCEG